MLCSRRGSRLVAFVVPVALGAGLACSGDGGGTQPAPTPTALVRVSGDGQTADAGQPVANALVVRVNDAQGRGVAGVAVAFSVTQGGGSVGAASVTTGSDGQASTSWTLGTTAGSAQQARAQVASPALGPVNFTATVVAGPAAKLERVSGDAQQSTQNSPLPQPLIVRVLDQYDNVVTGRAVTWTVLTGGGSMNPAASTSQANGQAQTTWTLGPAGPQTAEASATGLLGSPVGFGATAINLALTAVSPDTLVEGQAATLTGDGFDPTPANNTVMVGGVAATVTGATATTLNITVPMYDCQPARNVGVQVTVGGGTTPAITKRVRPGQFLGLAVGQFSILKSPTDLCVQLGPTSASEAYLVTLQSTASGGAGVTSARLRTTLGTVAAIAAAQLPDRSPASAIEDRRLDDMRRRLGQHRLAEVRVRDRERAFLARPDAMAAPYARTAGSSAFLVDSTVNVGDTVAVRYWNRDQNCAAFASVTTVVRAKGVRAIFLEDVANPAAGYSASDFSDLSGAFDGYIYSTGTSYFNDPTDLDGNARVVVVITKEVNRAGGGLLGFVTGCDFFARTEAPASNEGEFFYGAAPDPSGTFGPVYALADAKNDAPWVIAHEFAHIMQIFRRLAAGRLPDATFLLEGQATLGEEVTGHAQLGNSIGQNYGFSIAFNSPPYEWYVSAFVDLALYFGAVPNQSVQAAGAPEQCAWLADVPTHPCAFSPLWYGVTWSFLRWISDQHGPAYPGGEQAMHRAIVDNTVNGFANISSVVGVPIDSLLALWAATLYVDDRVPGLDARLSMSSWNLLNVFESGGLIPTARLIPESRGFAAFDDPLSVRDGSAAYYRVGGTSRPAAAIAARTGAGGVLPATMQLILVRLQ